MPAVTDIWFRADIELSTLGQQLGLTEIQEDAENFWHWIIGNFGDVLIDVTRTYTVSPKQTDTRLFLYPGHDEINASLADELVSRLLAIGIDPVHLGSWVYQRGNDYDKQIVERRTRESA